MTPHLPVDEHLPAIAEALRTHRAVVVTAAPGAGKTTRVPPALVGDGPVLLLQPRRVAARAIARRIADERRWTIGREVGWQVRFDRCDSPETRLLVVTEGILTARLQHDALLAGVRTVVIDEFHERSIHADLGLALVRQAWLARDDLRIVVMSATMDCARVAAFLGDCPIVDVPGRQFPIETSYRPGVSIETAVLEALPGARGAVLAFLPGAGEIGRAALALGRALAGRARVHELHGGLDADAQDEALSPSAEPRVILATNIAETTLTVPDVTVVVDAGFQKVARYDADRGVDSLDTERISQDAADQRSGRAGRVQAGRATRLWDARDRLRPHREPDIARVDLASPVMDIVAWGGDPRTFEWFEAPPRDALEQSLRLLAALGAVDGAGRLTPLGSALQRLPLHPRLARLLLAAQGSVEAATAVALLSERHTLPPAHASTPCDLFALADRERDLAPHVRRVARDMREHARRALGDAARSSIDLDTFRRAVLAAYPDRVGRRREPASDRFLLASGTGARLGRESGVVSAEFIVAVDVSSSVRPGAASSEAIVRIATAVEKDWLTPTATETVHRLDASSGRVRAVAQDRVGAIVVRERDTRVDPDVRARLLTEARVAAGPTDADRLLLSRLRSAGADATFAALVPPAAALAETLADVDLDAPLSADTRRRLDREAPLDLPLPSGRHARLDYRDDGRIVAAVKLQELFGLAETPRIGRARVPVTFELLAPNGRPVQVTTDLKSFWNGGYQEVRKQLRARYPKHPWPDDPWTATPTHRTRRRTPVK